MYTKKKPKVHKQNDKYTIYINSSEYLFMYTKNYTKLKKKISTQNSFLLVTLSIKQERDFGSLIPIYYMIMNMLQILKILLNPPGIHITTSKTKA